MIGKGAIHRALIFIAPSSVAEQGDCIRKGRHGEREKGQEEIGQARGPGPTRPVIDGD